MSEKEINNITEELTDCVISDHLNNKLGIMSLKEYILNKYKFDNDLDFIKIIFKLGNLLANRGYEIKIDIDKFDIVNYTNEEYKNYLIELNNLELNNKDILKSESLNLTKKLIDISKEKSISLTYSLKHLFKGIKLTQKEEIYLRVHTINNLADMGYKIVNINPLIIKKI